MIWCHDINDNLIIFKRWFFIVFYSICSVIWWPSIEFLTHLRYLVFRWYDYTNPLCHGKYVNCVTVTDENWFANTLENVNIYENDF